MRIDVVAAAISIAVTNNSECRVRAIKFAVLAYENVEAVRLDVLSGKK